MFVRSTYIYIALDSVFFFFFLNCGVPILKEVAIVLVITSSHSFLASVTAYSPFTSLQMPFNDHNLLNLNHQSPELIFLIIKSWFCKMREKEEKKKLFLGSVRREKRKKVKKPP